MKIRIYDIINKEMYTSEQITSVYFRGGEIERALVRDKNGNIKGVIISNNTAVIMHNTKLCDKNGKSIYGGDILRIKDSSGRTIIATIVYALTYMGWTIVNHENTMEVAKYENNGKYVKKSELHHYIKWGYDNSPYIEIIGNIYTEKYENHQSI